MKKLVLFVMLILVMSLETFSQEKSFFNGRWIAETHIENDIPHFIILSLKEDGTGKDSFAEMIDNKLTMVPIRPTKIAKWEFTDELLKFEMEEPGVVRAYQMTKVASDYFECTFVDPDSPDKDKVIRFEKF